MEYKGKAVFFDRDGVVNINKNFVHQVVDFEFVDGIFSVMKHFQEDYLLFIVTNQSGIARGYFTEYEVRKLHEWMLGEFEQNNVKVEKVYYCAHHPEYTGDCECRKPKPGMILNASKEYSLDLLNSIMIGDNFSDITAGKSAGVGTNILVDSNDLSKVFEFLYSEH